MARKKPVDDEVGCSDQRLGNTRRKLSDALDRLVTGKSINPTLHKTKNRFTVASLAREAGVGRNAIYSNHAGILEELRRASIKFSPQAAKRENRLTAQHRVIETLKLNERRLITENAALLKRTLEAEAQATRHCKQNAQLVTERDAALRCVSITPGKRL